MERRSNTDLSNNNNNNNNCNEVTFVMNRGDDATHYFWGGAGSRHAVQEFLFVSQSTPNWG